MAVGTVDGGRGPHSSPTLRCCYGTVPLRNRRKFLVAPRGTPHLLRWARVLPRRPPPQVESPGTPKPLRWRIGLVQPHSPRPPPCKQREIRRSIRHFLPRGVAERAAAVETGRPRAACTDDTAIAGPADAVLLIRACLVGGEAAAAECHWRTSVRCEKPPPYRNSLPTNAAGQMFQALFAGQ